MLEERRFRPRAKQTAVALWRRWIKLSAARRALAMVTTAVVIGGTWFTACNPDRITGTQSPQEHPPTGKPEHSMEVNEQRVPFTTSYGDPCTMEPIAFTGYMSTRISTTLDASGGIHFNVSIDQTSLSGVGTLSHNDYHASSEYHNVENTEGPAPLTTTVVDNFRILGPDPKDNFIFHMNSHLTVNANGVPTAQVDNVQADCR